MLASLKTVRGHIKEALRLFKQASHIEDRLIGDIFSIGSERERLGYLENIYRDYHIFLSFIKQYPSYSRVALDLVLRRKVIGAEALAIQRDAILSNKYPDLIPKLTELRSLRKEIARLTLEGPRLGEDLEKYSKLLANKNAKRDDLEEYLANQIPEIKLENTLSMDNIGAIAKVIPDGAALIELVRFNLFDFHRAVTKENSACYLAFILFGREADHLHMIDLGDAESIDMMIAAFRRSIIGEASRQLLPIDKEQGQGSSSIVRTPIDKGFALRAAVFDPLVDALNGRKRLLLALDGDLSTLPFEALPVTKDGRCLIDEYFISYLSTGRDMLRSGNGMGRLSLDPLVAADPDFDFGTSDSGVLQPTKLRYRKADIHVNFIRMMFILDSYKVQGRRV
jgi:hypothetical protein